MIGEADRAVGGVPRRLDHVQGLRAIAVLVIVIYHCGLPLSGGFLGVDVFFVISGYVIAGLLLREHHASGRVRFGQFYLRRIRRLLPALAVMLVVVAILSALFESPLTGQRTTGRVGTFAAVSLANWALYTTKSGYFAQAAETVPLLHTWSLAVEEQIYLFFPLLLAGALAVGRRRVRTLGWAVVAVAALSFVSLVLVAHGEVSLIHRPSSAAYYFPLTRSWEFAAGALVAIWQVSRPAATGRIALVIGAVGAAMTVAAFVVFTADGESTSPSLVAPVLGAALVLVACRGGGSLAHALGAAPLRWIGDRSYGWYLWHWPLIVFARDEWPDNRMALVAAALVALAVTVVSYRYIEQRFRYARRDMAPRQQRRSGLLIAAVCFLVPILVMATLRIAATHDWGSATVRGLDAQLTKLPPGARENGCPIAAALRSDSLQRCTVGSGHDPIYLLGDSNAGQWADGLIVAGQRRSRPVVLGWRPGCAFVDVTVLRPNYSATACDRYNDQMLRWLKRHREGVVVLAALNEYLDVSSATMRDRETGAQARDPAEKTRLWTAGTERSIQRLRAAGHEVMLLSTLPHPGGVDDEAKARWDPTDCGLLTMLRSARDCGITVSLQDEDVRQHDAITAELSAARAGRARYIDLREVVCPDGTCATVRDGRWIYRNGEHISVGESLRLAPYLERAIGS